MTEQLDKNKRLYLGSLNNVVRLVDAAKFYMRLSIPLMSF